MVRLIVCCYAINIGRDRGRKVTGESLASPWPVPGDSFFLDFPSQADQKGIKGFKHSVMGGQLSRMGLNWRRYDIMYYHARVYGLWFTAGNDDGYLMISVETTWSVGRSVGRSGNAWIVGSSCRDWEIVWEMVCNHKRLDVWVYGSMDLNGSEWIWIDRS